MKKIILYQQYLAPIGGIESQIYYLSNELKKYYDVELIYDSADKKQLERLNIKTTKRDKNKRYYADIVIKESTFGYPDNIFGLVYLFVIHACYDKLPNYRFVKWVKVDRLIAVSDAAKDSFLKLFPKEKVDVIYNIIPNFERKPKEKNKKLILMSAQRATEEKGMKRLSKMADKLDMAGIDYEWHLYTKTKEKINEHIIIEEPKLDLTEEMRKVDYIVALSDTESFCYTVHEALSLGTPVIVTDWEGVRETVKDGVNGYILDMNLKNLDIDKIVNHIPEDFKYVPKSSVQNWIDYFDSLNIELKKVVALHKFQDVKEGIKRNEGDVFEVTEQRYRDINNCDFCFKEKCKLVEYVDDEN